MFYLENTTFGFNPNKFLYDSFEEAFEELKEIADLHNRQENDRILDVAKEFCGSNEFNEEWNIAEVFD